MLILLRKKGKKIRKLSWSFAIKNSQQPQNQWDVLSLSYDRLKSLLETSYSRVNSLHASYKRSWISFFLTLWGILVNEMKQVKEWIKLYEEKRLIFSLSSCLQKLLQGSHKMALRISTNRKVSKQIISQN